MSRSTVISIDAMGGDRGPAPILTGMAHVLSEHPDLSFIAHGDEEKLGELLKRRPELSSRCEIRHAPDVVSMSEKPSRALRDGRNSSMWATLDTVAKGDAKVAISSGNTGALMAMAILRLRKAPGIDRPAIAVTWPSRDFGSPRISRKPSGTHRSSSRRRRRSWRSSEPSSSRSKLSLPAMPSSPPTPRLSASPGSPVRSQGATVSSDSTSSTPST